MCVGGEGNLHIDLGVDVRLDFGGSTVDDGGDVSDNGLNDIGLDFNKRLCGES